MLLRLLLAEILIFPLVIRTLSTAWAGMSTFSLVLALAKRAALAAASHFELVMASAKSALVAKLALVEILQFLLDLVSRDLAAIFLSKLDLLSGDLAAT
jgi:hypothetical protein